MSESATREGDLCGIPTRDASTESRPTFEAMNALQVFLRDERIRAWLDEHDPNSVEQAIAACHALARLHRLLMAVVSDGEIVRFLQEGEWPRAVLD